MRYSQWEAAEHEERQAWLDTEAARRVQLTDRELEAKFGETYAIGHPRAHPLVLGAEARPTPR